MKSYIDTPPPQKPAFVPKTICITCETQAELDALGTLFSHSRILDAVQTALGVRPMLNRIFLDAGTNIYSNIPKLTASMERFFKTRAN